jgi:replication factor C small subunit
MSSLPWIEKYRPKTLDEVVDQEEVISSLKSILRTKAIPHMLFTGPPGVGKTATAHALARDLYGPKYIAQGLFLEINASDERGIQVIREKVKTFARSVSFSDVGFRILLLDESDQLTPEAQHSLRRTMELYSSTCRFILAANYSNRIIEPIQSRCAIFRFKPLQKDKVVDYLRKIAEMEKIEVTDKALEEIYEFSEGDLRKCINALQAASTYSEKIDEKIVYKVFGQVNRGNVRKMIELALANKFEDSLKVLREILYIDGTSSNDLINALFKEIMKLNLPDEKKLKLIDFLGEVDYRISEGATPEIQLMAFLTKLVS